MDNNINDNRNPDGTDYPNSIGNYGAVYSRNESGEYTYTPYTQSVPGTNGAQHTAGTAAGPAKKRRTGLIIGITCAVLACITAFFAAGAGLIILSGKYLSIVGDKNESTQLPSGGEVSVPVGSIQVSDRKDPDVLLTEIKAGELMNVAQVVAKVKDSVVEITTETVTGGSGIYSQYVVSGAGSGVIISDTGIIITNNHVISGATKITVRLTDGTEFTAKLIGTDPDADIAVISVNPAGKHLTAAVLGKSNLLVVGEEIVVIGNPLGELGGTVTNGIISATEREVIVESSGTMTLLQTNAAVNPGNSGGGMFNLYGELVGIVNAKSSGDNIEGIGFAIPVNTAWAVADELINYGYVKGRATIDIQVLEVTNPLYARYYFGSSALGVYVFETKEALGLEYGDRIVSYNGIEVSYASELKALLKKSNVGDKVTLIVMRGGRSVTVEVELVEKTPELNQNSKS
ncbi:MAG: trypsin-like peptidase domain-containing protein [Clostridia bacterium]|nr:trypsin-like peptidase domain-containing protein [Clostridia bacterium]